MAEPRAHAIIRCKVRLAWCPALSQEGRACHSDFGPGDFGPAGPKSPENTAGISVRGTIITRDIGPGPDILVRVADLRLGSYASAVVAYTQPLA